MRTSFDEAARERRWVIRRIGAKPRGACDESILPGQPFSPDSPCKCFTFTSFRTAPVDFTSGTLTTLTAAFANTMSRKGNHTSASSHIETAPDFSYGLRRSQTAPQPCSGSARSNHGSPLEPFANAFFTIKHRSVVESRRAGVNHLVAGSTQRSGDGEAILPGSHLGKNCAISTFPGRRIRL